MLQCGDALEPSAHCTVSCNVHDKLVRYKSKRTTIRKFVPKRKHTIIIGQCQKSLPIALASKMNTPLTCASKLMSVLRCRNSSMFMLTIRLLTWSMPRPHLTSCVRGNTICLRPLQDDNIFAFICQVAVLLRHDNIFVFIRQVAPVPACWLFKTSATSWPLTFWPWKWCPNHVWRGLPLCQFQST